MSQNRDRVHVLFVSIPAHGHSPGLAWPGLAWPGLAWPGPGRRDHPARTPRQLPGGNEVHVIDPPRRRAELAREAAA